MYMLLLLIFLPVILITVMTPYVTRKTESFGVTIPYGVYKHPEVIFFRKTYAWQTGFTGIILVIFLAVCAKFVSEESWALVFTIGLFLYFIFSFIVYLRFHVKMKELKKKEKWHEKQKEVLVIDMDFYHKKLTYSNGWFAIPLAITVFNFFWTWFNYDRFPEMLPMQYSFDGHVTTWAVKSPGTLLAFPLTQLFLTGLFLLSNTIIRRSKQQIDPEHPEQSVSQNIIFRRRWSLFTIISGTLVVSLFLVPQITFIYPVKPIFLFVIVFGITAAIIFGALAIAVTTGQGGSRIKTALDKNGRVMNRDDDQYWKLGIFYFNPDDPAVWVEKRFGVGWTCNFARPASWLFLTAVLLIPVLIAFFTYK